MGQYRINGEPLSGFSRDASDIDFDNTGTGLSSTDVQGAISEINSNLTIKTYSVTMTPSSDVPGYNKIGFTDIPTADLSAYGTPFSAVAEDVGIAVAINSNTLVVSSNRTDITHTVKVTFAKHIIAG